MLEGTECDDNVGKPEDNATASRGRQMERRGMPFEVVIKKTEVFVPSLSRAESSREKTLERRRSLRNRSKHRQTSRDRKHWTTVWGLLRMRR